MSESQTRSSPVANIVPVFACAAVLIWHALQQGTYYSFFKRKDRAFKCPGLVE